MASNTTSSKLAGLPGPPILKPPPSCETVLLIKRVPVNATEPALNPPPVPAPPELPWKSPPVPITPALTAAPPPPLPALLATKRVSRNVSVPLLPVARPPPLKVVAVLF